MKLPALLLTLLGVIASQSAWGQQKDLPGNWVTKHIPMSQNQKNESKISDIVYLVKPRLGRSHADRFASYIMEASKTFELDPYLILATAYAESEFSMHSGPCVGVMQVYLPTWRAYDKKWGSPYELRGNIMSGTAELSRHYRRSRGRYASRASYALGRYNGSSPGGSYARKVLRVYERMKEQDIASMRGILKRGGALWN